jgi:hypothetical protein
MNDILRDRFRAHAETGCSVSEGNVPIEHPDELLSLECSFSLIYVTRFSRS